MQLLRLGKSSDSGCHAPSGLLGYAANKVGASLHEADERWLRRIACPRQDWTRRLIAHDRSLDLVGENEKRPKIHGGIVGRLGSLVGYVCLVLFACYWNFAISAL